MDANGRNRLGGAVPSPAAAFLLTLLILPTLFWLVTVKRTTQYTVPEEWLMEMVVPQIRPWVVEHVPALDALIVGISGLGAGWFVAIGFALCGLVALAKGRTDLALVLAAGTLAFPVEWVLKFFTAIPAISLSDLWSAMLNVGGVGLDDIADFPAGHALRATVFYGLVAYCIARLVSSRREGMIAAAVAVAIVAAISATRIYLAAHYPIDVLGGWMAGAALLSVIVAVDVLAVAERVRREDRDTIPAPDPPPRRVAVPLHRSGDD